MADGGTLRTVQLMTWDDVKSSASTDRKLIVISGGVYDVTHFIKRHPGGARVVGHYVGSDATDAWVAFHDRKELVSKYMKPLEIGRIPNYEPENEVAKDFRRLRKTAEGMGLFKANPWFFALHLAHIILLDVAGYAVLKYGLASWPSYLMASALFATAQAQAGWTQHDYGHLSVFRSRSLNHLAHRFVIGTLKGAGSHWWNFRHFQHHAKPNVLKKDPDINIAHVFLLGKKLPVEWGSKKRGFMPYQWQHDYFHLLGPPALLPLYFHIENIYFIFKRREWVDLTFIASFFTIWQWFLSPVCGSWMSALGLYFFVRFLESHWFTYVTQMSHIPMEIDREQGRDWFTQQLVASANVDGSWFNDWFTGHLNYQIEHHLFPTMPRHNYHKIQPLVKSLCQKHGITYTCNNLYTAFANILRSLKKSGELWHEAYTHS